MPLALVVVALAGCHGPDAEDADLTDTDADTDADVDTDGTGDTSSPSCIDVNAAGTFPIVVVDSTVGAGDDDAGSCGGAPAADVHLDFTAPADNRYSFSLAGSSYDALLYVRDGCGGVELGCDADPVDGDVLVLDLALGDNVVIGVDGVDGASGDFTLTIDEVPATESNCADGVDEDVDTLTDCADPDCIPTCGPLPPEAVCTDGVDDDFDTFVDCADNDCAFDASCIVVGGCPNVIANPPPVSIRGTTVGETDDYEAISTWSCPWTYSGAPDYTVQYTASVDGYHGFQLGPTANGVLDDLIIYVLDGCGGTQLMCDDEAVVDGSDTALVALVAGQTVIAVVDGWDAGVAGEFDLQIHPLEAFEVNCVDGFDDDFDLAWDCADYDCAADPACMVPN